MTAPARMAWHTVERGWSSVHLQSGLIAACGTRPAHGAMVVSPLVDGKALTLCRRCFGNRRLVPLRILTDTPEQKIAARATVASETARYLARGGRIVKLTADASNRRDEAAT